MKNCFKAVCAALVAFVATMGQAYAQRQISGQVVDQNGLSVIGASVLEKGSTTNGVVVDLDGNFTITATDGAVFVVSCIGYTDHEFTVTPGQNSYKVVLSEDALMLEQTVVIGYGTARVRDLTGSVATVSSDELTAPVSNVAEALQGKMAGVVVSLNDGTPGSAPQIRVRGAKSITQTNDPLYIVDGFPMSDLSSVPADQIKSINVLKDAAATAIYGSRGASGVVLVTTKNAVEGQTTVSYNGYVQMKDSSGMIQDAMTDPYDYLKFTLGYARDYNQTNYENMLSYFGIGSAYGNHYSDYANAKVRNYQEDIYKTAIAHSHNLTISNGGKKNKTIFSLNYLYDDGTVINSYYNRINASLKTIENLTDRLSLELNVSYAYTNNRGGYNRSSGSLAAQAYRYSPLEPLGDATNIAGFGTGSSYIEKSYDPIELINNEQNNTYNHGFTGIAAINWKPIDDLTLRSEIGLNKNFRKIERYDGGYGNETNDAYLARRESGNVHWTTTASYQIPFRDKSRHRGDVMVGNEMISNMGEQMAYYAYEFPSNFDRDYTFAFMNQFTESDTFTTTYDTPSRSVSWFTRMNYTFLDRYMFTLTVRADGSSKFAPNNRWGYFPAGAFAWRISDEPFMKGTRDWLSNLKLRLSYGVTGSDAISSNLWRETWALGSNTNYTISGQREETENDYGQPYNMSTLMPNPNLKWESTITRNLGLDYGFFDDRLYGAIEGYWSTTNDLLMPVAVNPSTGYTYQYQNMGVVSNKGLELSIGGDIVKNRDFTLSANFIYNYNVNRIEELSESVMVNTYGQWASSEGTPSTGEYVLLKGSAIGTVRGYKYLGWYTTDDFNYDPATGVYTLKDGVPDISGSDSFWTSFNLPAGQTAFPGAPKWEDIDGDGSLTIDDTYVVGEMTPRSTGSFNLSARWKNLDFSANFNYVIGGMIMNVEGLYSSYGAKDNRFGANRLSTVADAYSPYTWGSNGELVFVDDPAQLDAMNANASMHTPSSMLGFLFDTYLEDASYLRLKSLTLGYTLPQKWTKKIGVNNLRVYFTGGNLWTLTGYSGLDPEVNTNSTSGSYGFPTPGVDRNAYPKAVTYTFGLNITL